MGGGHFIETSHLMEVGVVSGICRLQTVDCRLQTADCSLQTTDYSLQTTDYRLQTPCSGPQCVDYKMLTENHWPQTTEHDVHSLRYGCLVNPQ